MDPESSRGERRQKAYGQVLRRACTFSLAFHLFLSLLVNPSIVLRLFRPDVPVGYPGSPRRGDLAPLESGKDRYTLYRVRRYSGPVTLTKLVVLGNRPPLETASPDKGEPTVGRIGRGGSRDRAIPGRMGGSVNSPVIELGEDWSMVQRSGAPAQSEKFQALKIVRPQYPEEAVKAGVQGLVKLRVEVDENGTVVEARAIENSAKNEALANASISAMHEWKFRPYLVESMPVPFTVLVPFRYRLIDDEVSPHPLDSGIRRGR